VTTEGWQADADGAARAALDSWGVLCDNSPGGWFAERGGLVRASTGIPFAPFNGVWSVTGNVATADVLAAVDEFAAGDLPWNLQLRPGYPAELDDELAGRGLVVTEDVPFMVLPDPTLLAATVQRSAATYRQVETFADLDSLLSLLERGMSLPPELAREAFPMRLMFLATTWIATDGQDVATGLGWVQDGWCGVFNVAPRRLPAVLPDGPAGLRAARLRHRRDLAAVDAEPVRRVGPAYQGHSHGTAPQRGHPSR
jgi:hypothetical protein